MNEEHNKIALYGLGTETERFLNNHKKEYCIEGLLDSYRISGEVYGYPIISIQHAVEIGVKSIIVIARPGSCKVIAKKIREVCLNNDICLLDVRGNDLLELSGAKYDFSGIEGYTKEELKSAIDKADIISFDLFDTLISRKFYYYTDIFELLEVDPLLRLNAEKELSKFGAPKLLEIYEKVIKDGHYIDKSSEALAEAEWNFDFSSMFLRNGMRDILLYAKNNGKQVVLTTDCYYSAKHVKDILARFNIDFFDDIFVSSESGTSKTQELYSKVLEGKTGVSALHIGDDEYADVEKARLYGFDTFRIYSGKDLFDLLGGMGIETWADTYSDRVKLGLYIAKQFSDPFQFEDSQKRMMIDKAANIGDEICAPVITDFTIWMDRKCEEYKFDNLLLCARDGYIIDKIWKKINSKCREIYFLTSRTAAIRAGVTSETDVEYVDSMKYFGDEKENLLVRFGINCETVDLCRKNDIILSNARMKRKNYMKYMDSLQLSRDNLGIFDFVAKGTTQFFIQKIIKQHLVGLYFLQLEPEFMSDKNLEIDSFYKNEERDDSVIFDNYYILETVLTSLDPSVDEFDDQGRPVYSSETRSRDNLDCVTFIQEGIMEYVDDYLKMVPKDKRLINKKINEAFLSLINKISITDPLFNSLVIEDPFFGRMTDIKDVM